MISRRAQLHIRWATDFEMLPFCSKISSKRPKCFARPRRSYNGDPLIQPPSSSSFSTLVEIQTTSRSSWVRVQLRRYTLQFRDTTQQSLAAIQIKMQVNAIQLIERRPSVISGFALWVFHVHWFS